MVQDGGCGHVVNTRISGGRIGFGFTTLGSARLTNCTVAGVHFGVSIVVNKPAEVVMEDNKITAKLLVMPFLHFILYGCCVIQFTAFDVAFVLAVFLIHVTMC